MKTARNSKELRAVLFPYTRTDETSSSSLPFCLLSSKIQLIHTEFFQEVCR